jgi:hypothetical protein
MNGILLPAYITGINALKDKSIKLTIVTQEMSPDKAGELFSINGHLGYVYISSKTIDNKEIDTVDKLDPEFGGKTQSQRLRAVLYRLFEVKPEGFKNFDNYYHHKTEEIINHLKSKLD